MVRSQKVNFHTSTTSRNTILTGVVLHFRPYLHMYAHSNELEEKGVINLNAVNIESNPDMEILLGVSRWFSAGLFTLGY